MSQEIVRELVGGVWRTVRRKQSGGGGSQPLEVVRIPFAFDTPNLQARVFGISSVDQGAKKFNLLQDYSEFFAPGDTITVSGSTGNDGTYTVASTSGTDVAVVEAIPDGTADGNLFAENARVGITVYTPAVGDVLVFVGVSITTQFSPSSVVEIGWADDYSALLGADAGTEDSPLDAHFMRTGTNHVDSETPAGNDLKMGYFADTSPLQALLDDGGAGLYPDVTVGEGEIVLLVLKASA